MGLVAQEKKTVEKKRSSKKKRDSAQARGPAKKFKRKECRTGGGGEGPLE